MVARLFANGLGRPLALGSLVNQAILPALNRCERCGKAESDHEKADLQYRRNERIPEWHGWHAARRGLGSNLYRLGVHELVIQRILRHANVSTTASYYIKSAADDVRERNDEAGKPDRRHQPNANGHYWDTNRSEQRAAQRDSIACEVIGMARSKWRRERDSNFSALFDCA